MITELAPFGTYNVCGWKDGERVTFLEGLSIDAARHIAQTHAQLGEGTRIHFEDYDNGDYCETYCPHGTVRRGRFADVLLTVKAGEGVGAYHIICCEKVLRA